MKLTKTTQLAGIFAPWELDQHLFGDKLLPLEIDARHPEYGYTRRGSWKITVEFTPEEDLELQKSCTCKRSADGAVLFTTVAGAASPMGFFGPCADGSTHSATCPLAVAAMKVAKWPCGKLVYPELSEKKADQ